MSKFSFCFPGVNHGRRMAIDLGSSFLRVPFCGCGLCGERWQVFEPGCEWAAEGGEASADGDDAWSRDHGQLSVAGGCDVTRDEKVGWGRDGLHTLDSRSASGTRCDSKTAHAIVEHWKYFAAGDWRQVLLLHAARRDAEPAGALCAREFGGKRSCAGGCESAGGGWNDRARLVPAFGEWKVSRLWDFAERVGDEHAAHYRNHDRQVASRYD